MTNPNDAVRMLLRRAQSQLLKWAEKYGEHNPSWLPPAGDVRLMEDMAEFLDCANVQAEEVPAHPERILGMPPERRLIRLLKGLHERFPDVDTKGFMNAPDSGYLDAIDAILKPAHLVQGDAELSRAIPNGWEIQSNRTGTYNLVANDGRWIIVTRAPEQGMNLVHDFLTAILQSPASVDAQMDAKPAAVVVTIAQGNNTGKQVKMLRDLPNGAMLYASPIPVLMSDEQVDVITESVLHDIIGRNLTSLYCCTRIWSAWSIGTMDENDFTPLEDTEFASELAAEIYAAIAAQAALKEGKS